MLDKKNLVIYNIVFSLISLILCSIITYFFATKYHNEYAHILGAIYVVIWIASLIAYYSNSKVNNNNVLGSLVVIKSVVIMTLELGIMIIMIKLYNSTIEDIMYVDTIVPITILVMIPFEALILLPIFLEMHKEERDQTYYSYLSTSSFA